MHARAAAHPLTREGQVPNMDPAFRLSLCTPLTAQAVCSDCLAGGSRYLGHGIHSP